VIQDGIENQQPKKICPVVKTIVFCINLRVLIVCLFVSKEKQEENFEFFFLVQPLCFVF